MCIRDSHELFPAAQRLDQLFVLIVQRQLRQLVQPFHRHRGADDLIEQRFQSLEMAAEHLIETVVVALVLHQRRPRQIIKSVSYTHLVGPYHTGYDHPALYRLPAGHGLGTGDRYHPCGHDALHEALRLAGPAIGSPPTTGSSLQRLDNDLQPVSYTHLDVYKRQV